MPDQFTPGHAKRLMIALLALEMNRPSTQHNETPALNGLANNRRIRMSSPKTNHLDQADRCKPDKVPCERKTRDLHVKGVPEAIWCRGRCHATQSGMSFKEYLITLIANGAPVKPEPNRGDE